jgi:lysophospholipase L1-like esterase
MSTVWTAAWTQAMTDIRLTGLAADDQTIRVRVVASIAGEQMRLTLSNSFADAPLRVGRTVVRAGGAVAEVRFAGAQSVEIRAGQEVVSDAVPIAVASGDAVDVDFYLPQPATLATGNIASAQWYPSVAGDHTGADPFPTDGTPTMPHPDGGEIPLPAPLLRGVDVAQAAGDAVVVCLGDSITAAGWPDRAAARLRGRGIAVLNRGIGGNRLRYDGAGPLGAFFGRAGVDRFDDDVLATAGRTHVVIALGTNDLGHPGASAPAEELPSAQELIDALDATADRARAAGLGVFLATITPFLPAPGYDASREQTRQSVNAWIRAQESRARIIDFDEALRSDAEPSRLDDDFDSGDHLHPSERGQDRMAAVAAEVIGATV